MRGGAESGVEGGVNDEGTSGEGGGGSEGGVAAFPLGGPAKTVPEARSPRKDAESKATFDADSLLYSTKKEEAATPLR